MAKVVLAVLRGSYIFPFEVAAAASVGKNNSVRQGLCGKGIDIPTAFFADTGDEIHSMSVLRSFEQVDVSE
jgi:hypothetical protein